MRRVRWSCPNGHVDVLGPSRPRRDNVCRYCLPCSQLLGRLTGRTALSLMRESEKRRESRGARHEARETARAARETAHYTVAGIDLRVEMARYWRLDAIKGAPYPKRPEGLELKIVRCARKPRKLGHMSYSRGQIAIYVYPELMTTDVRETLLHEVVHCATRSGHDVRFKTVFRLASEEAFGVRPRLATPRWHGEVATLVCEKSAAADRAE